MQNLQKITLARIIKEVFLRYCYDMACSIRTLRRLILGLMLCLAPEAMAQQDPAFVQYWSLESQYNPAAVGKWDQLNIVAGLQTHAMGFDDAGMTLYAGADCAFRLGKTRHGVGASFQTDNIGLFSHKKVSVQYAYQLQFGKHHRLSIGAEADLLQEGLDLSKADVEDGGDPVFSGGEVNGSRIDASAGIYYQWKDLSAGISVAHITAPTVELGDKNEIHVKRHYYANAAYVIHTRNPYFKIVPSAIFRTDFTQYRGDVTARFIFERDKNSFDFGLNYAPRHSVALFLGCVFHGVNLRYSYEANIRGMGLGAGQHEVTLGYQLPLNLQKKGRNLHRSVRWL